MKLNRIEMSVYPRHGKGGKKRSVILPFQLNPLDRSVGRSIGRFGAAGAIRTRRRDRNRRTDGRTGRENATDAGLRRRRASSEETPDRSRVRKRGTHSSARWKIIDRLRRAGLIIAPSKRTNILCGRPVEFRRGVARRRPTRRGVGRERRDDGGDDDDGVRRRARTRRAGEGAGATEREREA